MVLLIDDDPAVRSLLAAVLNRDGIPSEPAQDGVEAIARLRRGSRPRQAGCGRRGRRR